MPVDTTSDPAGMVVGCIRVGRTDFCIVAAEFVLFQRTPNLALPMKQVEYKGDGKQTLDKERYEEVFKGRVQSFPGFDFNFMSTMTFEHSKEERLAVYESLWDHGDFHFWLATYSDMLFSDEANTEAYNFWYSFQMHLKTSNYANTIVGETKYGRD